MVLWATLVIATSGCVYTIHQVGFFELSCGFTPGENHVHSSINIHVIVAWHLLNSAVIL